MKVFYRARRGSLGQVAVYEQTKPPAFCCEAMARQWGQLIGFGLKGYCRSTSREVNLYSMLEQVGHEPVCILTEICFCPFCGEPVEVCLKK